MRSGTRNDNNAQLYSGASHCLSLPAQAATAARKGASGPRQLHLDARDVAQHGFALILPCSRLLVHVHGCGPADAIMTLPRSARAVSLFLTRHYPLARDSPRTLGCACRVRASLCAALEPRRERLEARPRAFARRALAPPRRRRARARLARPRGALSVHHARPTPRALAPAALGTHPPTHTPTPVPPGRRRARQWRGPAPFETRKKAKAKGHVVVMIGRMIHIRFDQD